MFLGKIRLVIRCLLSLMILFGLGGFGHYAQASTGSDLQHKISDLAKQQQEKQNQVNQTSNKIKANKNQQQAVEQKITMIHSEITLTSAKITDKQHSINDTQTQIDQLNKQITVVKTRITRRDQLLKERVKAMYETGGSASYLQLLLSAQNFGEFVSRVLALNMIANQDQHILNQQIQDKAELNTQQNQVKVKLIALNSDMNDLQSLKASLASKQSEQHQLLTSLEKQEKDLEKDKFSQQEVADNLSAEQVAAKKAYAMWKAEEARQAAAAAKASNSGSQSASSSGSTYPESSAGSSSTNNPGAILSWPVAGGYVTSGYGYRSFDHSFHPGIDIGKGEGTPIMAAADGVVFRAYVSSSYGNCVMITHYINGAEYTTVYAHMERFIVSDGEAVKRGQVIGYMGATGEAFGPHLHFEVYHGPWTPPPHTGSFDPLTVLP